MIRFKTVDGTYYITDEDVDGLQCPNRWVEAKSDNYGVKVWINTNHIVSIDRRD